MKHPSTPTHRLTLLTFGVLLNLLWLGAPAATAQKIPDANFAQAIREQCPTCIDAENNLLPPAKTLTSLSVFSKNIASIEGVVGFEKLTFLGCSSNRLTELPSLPASLTGWYFSNNRLTNLPTIPANVRVLYVGYNELTSLPELPAGLKNLGFPSNQIASIAPLPSGLDFFDCSYTNLQALPELPATLTDLYCAGLRLASLPSLPPRLGNLVCNDNEITALPTLPNTLQRLRIDAAKITCLPNAVEGLKVFSGNDNDPIPTPPVCGTAPVETGINIPDANFAQAIREQCPGCINENNNLLAPAKFLTRLEVSNKNIASIEGVIGFTGLTSISCFNNKLTTLPALPGKLTEWGFSANLLTSLPEIPSNLRNLSVSGNKLSTLPALPAGLTGLDFSRNSVSSFPALPAGLQFLSCGNNPLNAISGLPSSIQYLYCGGLGLTSLPALPSNLIALGCEDNSLNSLPMLSTSLTSLTCHNNNITSLPTLPGTLQQLRIDAEKITCLPNAVEGLKVYNDFGRDPIPTPPVCSTTPTAPANCYALGDMCSGNAAEVVSQTIAMSTAGSKTLTLSYRASEGVATLRMMINGTTTSITLPQTPGDRSYQSVSLGTYALNAGNNSVTLSSGNGYACFRQLCTEGSTPVPDPTPTPTTCLALGDQCSGNASEIKTYTLNQAAAGSKMLKLTYRAGEGESKLRLMVNGTLHMITLPQTAGGGAYATAEIGSYALNAGNNAITMASGSGYLCFRQLCAEGSVATTPEPAPATCLALGDQCSGNASEIKTFTLNQATAGSRMLKLTYRAGEGESKLRLMINGTLHMITLPQTAGGGTYATAEIGSYALNAGNNAITMASGSGYLCFRQLCVEGIGVPAPATCLALGDQCSGNASEIKTFTLNQSAAGSQMLKLTYRAGEGESKLRLTINGTLHMITLPQTAGGGTYRTIALGTFPLNAGNNTITMATGQGYLCFRQLCVEGAATNNVRLAAEEVLVSTTSLATYPNPTTGTFEASFYLAPGQRASLNVNDMLGRPIWTKALTGQGDHKEQVRLPEAASGMFILRLQRENAQPGQAAEFTKVLVVK